MELDFAIVSRFCFRDGGCPQCQDLGRLPWESGPRTRIVG
jgi:hypothetical protein